MADQIPADVAAAAADVAAQNPEQPVLTAEEQKAVAALALRNIGPLITADYAHAVTRLLTTLQNNEADVHGQVRNRLGETFYLQDLTFYTAYLRDKSSAGVKRFWELVSQAVPEIKMQSCDRCKNPILNKLGFEVKGSRHFVCNDCAMKWYYQCQFCGDRYHKNATVREDRDEHFWKVVNGNYACHDCHEKQRAAKTIFRCSNCENWYTDYPDYRGQVDGECRQCSPPDASRCQSAGKLDFEFPALILSGEHKAIKAEEIAEVSIGGGDVSDGGMQQIVRFINEKTNDPNYGGGLNLSAQLKRTSGFDVSLKGVDGGFTKRLGKVMAGRNLKFSEEFMNQIGQIAQQHVSKPTTQRIGFTRNVNRPARVFLNDGSCWWGGYHQSRCHFKALGGIAIRTFSEKGGKEVPISRCWMLALDEKLVPTIELPAFGYLTFNAYGAVDGVTFARLIGDLTGKSFKAIRIAGTGEQLYINSSAGFLIADPGTLARYDQIPVKVKRSCRCS